jgi:galactokinase
MMPPTSGDAGSPGSVTASLRSLGIEPGATFFVPGRIEVLGKHTDYAGGRSLLCCTEQGFLVAAGAGAPGMVEVVDVDGGRRVQLPLAPESGSKAMGWELYPATVVARVARDFPGIQGGAALSFSSTLPPASGMSSSSALVVSVFLGVVAGCGLDRREDFQALFGRGIRGGRQDRERLADYLAAVESGRPYGGLGGGAGARGVGTDGGSEDHTAILCGEAGHLARYRFRPTRAEGSVALPPGWVFAVAASGVLAEKAVGAREAYNRLSEEVKRIAALWRRETGGSEPHPGAILASAPGARDHLERILSDAGEEALLARLRQFAMESDEVIPAAATALERGELDSFGRLVARSQAGAEGALGNQLPETIHLARSAGRLGAAAASAFGAGFGGAVWALTPREGVEAFLDGWQRSYLNAFPHHGEAARFLWTEAGSPAAYLGGPDPSS